MLKYISKYLKRVSFKFKTKLFFKYSLNFKINELN